MENEEKNKIKSQELTQRIGKNGDRILRENLDDIGLANEINHEVIDLINRLRVYGVDIKKCFLNVEEIVH